MTRLHHRLGLLCSILMFWLTLTGVATPPLRAASGGALIKQTVQGFEYKIALTGNTYEIYMRPNITPGPPNLTLTAQVTIKVPHGVGANRFVISDLQSAVAGTLWSATSRIDAPTEDTSADYISFVVDFPGSNRGIYQWTTGQAVKVFTFKNAGPCLGAVELLTNSDRFNQLPNSAGTNPGNQITVLGLNGDNQYINNYDPGSANCTPAANNDSDGDGVPDKIEDVNNDGDNNPATNPGPDTDGDGKPNYLDTDDDGDTIPTHHEDLNNDGNPANDDSDGDGKPNYLDNDDDNDNVPTGSEDINGDGDPTNDDTDGDVIWNYVDLDDDGDGALSQNEDPNQNKDPRDDDSDGDHIPDYLDPDDFPPGAGDSDQDHVPDNNECPTGVPCRDSDGDGRPDYLDKDDDGDGINTIDEDPNHNGNPMDDDSDRDNKPDYLDNDNSVGIEFGLFYRKGIYEVYMRPNGDPKAPNLTLTAQVTLKVPHGDGINRFTISSLSSGVAGTQWSLTSRIDAPVEDPTADYLSFIVAFTAGDHGVYHWTAGEEIKVFSFKNAGACLGVVKLLDNALDPFNRLPNSVGTNPGNQIDVMGIERDNAYIGNYGSVQANCTVMDSDGDGVLDPTEDANTDGDNNPATNPGPDTDGDRIPNYLDPDDDGDTIPTAEEDANLDGDLTNDDNDRDGIPDYLDPNDRIGGIVWNDQNGDGLRQVNEARMPNVTVALYNAANAVSRLVMTTTTSAGGEYQFVIRVAGPYYVEFVAPSGVVPTKANQGNDDAIDSDGLRTGLELVSRSDIVRPAYDNRLHARDDGFVVPATISTTVYNDQNKNGERDAGESPVPGATIIVYDSAGNEVARVVADEDGIFTIDNLAPDQYSIKVIPPVGFETILDGLIPLAPLEPGGSITEDLGVAPQNQGGKPIELISLTASAVEAGVLVRWETALEKDVSGFHIHWGMGNNFSASSRLTSRLVLSQGSQGGAYALVLPYNPVYDPPLHELRFWLVEVQLDGVEKEYGPVSILGLQIFLPAVAR